MVPTIRASGSLNALVSGPSGLRGAGRASTSTGGIRERGDRGSRGAVRPVQGRAGSPGTTDKAPESELGSADWALGGVAGAMTAEKSVRGAPVLAWQALASSEALQSQVVNSVNCLHNVVSRPGSRSGSRPGSLPNSRPNSRAGNEPHASHAGLELFRDCDRELTSFLLQKGRTKFAEAGEVLVEGGRGDTDVYILRRGEADVEVGGCAVLQLTGQAAFSEMKLLGSGSSAACAVTIRAKTLCECRIFSQSVLLHARRHFPNDKHFLVQLKQNQQQLELKIERAARSGDLRHPVSSLAMGNPVVTRDCASSGTSGVLMRSESLPTLNTNSSLSMGLPLQAPHNSTGSDLMCMEMATSDDDTCNHMASAIGATSRAYSPARSPSRSPSPEPTALSEELRQRRLLVLSRLTAVCTGEAVNAGPSSQKSSPHPASESSASLMSLEPPFSTKGAPARMAAGASLGSSLEWLVMPQQAGVALPSGLLPSSGTGTTASSSVQASRPVTPREQAKELARPTNHTHVPIADGLPGTEPDSDDELPRFISAEDDDELPRLVRAASRGTSRASTPADVVRPTRRRSRNSGQATPPHMAHALAPGNVAANDFERTKSQLYEAARELVLPTRRCARAQQARTQAQRACLADTGRKLLAR